LCGVVINSGGGLSAAYGGEDIFLPQMKTTFPSRQKGREKVLWCLGHLASISVHHRRMSCASGIVINSSSGFSPWYGGEDVFLPLMKTTFATLKNEREKVLYCLGQLASTCTPLRRVICVSGAVINTSGRLSAAYGGVAMI